MCSKNHFVVCHIKIELNEKNALRPHYVCNIGNWFLLHDFYLIYFNTAQVVSKPLRASWTMTSPIIGVFVRPEKRVEGRN